MVTLSNVSSSAARTSCGERDSAISHENFIDLEFLREILDNALRKVDAGGGSDGRGKRGEILEPNVIPGSDSMEIAKKMINITVLQNFYLSYSQQYGQTHAEESST